MNKKKTKKKKNKPKHVRLSILLRGFQDVLSQTEIQYRACYIRKYNALPAKLR